MSKYKDLRFTINAEDKTAKAFKSLGNNLIDTASKFKSLCLSVANIKTIALSVIGGVFVKGIIDTGDKIDKLNTKLGISTEALSQYQYATSSCGVTFETFTNSIQKMNLRIAEAVNGEGEAVKILKELKINALDFKELKPEDQFEVIADRLLEVKNNADKVRIANKLFEESGISLLQMLNNGSNGLRDMRQEAYNLGYTMSNQDVKTFASFNNSILRLNTSLKGLATAVLTTVIPPIVFGLDLIQSSFISTANKSGKLLNNLKQSYKIFVEFFFDCEDGITTSLKVLNVAFDYSCNFISKAWLALKASIVRSITVIMGSIGSLMNLIGNGLNKINIDNKFTNYLKDKGSILGGTIDEFDDYLNGILKASEVNKKFDKQLDLIKSKKSGINKDRINFSKTEFPIIDLKNEKEYNELLKFRDQILKEVQTPQENYTNQLNILNQVNQANLLTQEQYNTALEKYNNILDKANGINSFAEMIKNIKEGTTDLATTLQTALGNTIDGISQQIANLLTTGKANFAELGLSIANMIAQMTIKLMILKALTSSLGVPTLLFGFAKGGVFKNGNIIQPFANGGIVNNPTLFPISNNKTGLMGENGAEAIIPLSRGANGKLGVRLYDDNKNNINTPQNINNNIYFNVSSNNPEEFRRSRAEIENDLIACLERANRNR